MPSSPTVSIWQEALADPVCLRLLMTAHIFHVPGAVLPSLLCITSFFFHIRHRQIARTNETLCNNLLPQLQSFNLGQFYTQCIDNQSVYFKVIY
ncbi:hypothetical protein LY78DRAFT_31175 [Colletotrichum sublineola]|nr:hypothetical protein LY78DRAFT_31175 [Colletotrichum sublineola]